MSRARNVRTKTDCETCSDHDESVRCATAGNRSAELDRVAKRGALRDRVQRHCEKMRYRAGVPRGGGVVRRLAAACPSSMRRSVLITDAHPPPVCSTQSATQCAMRSLFECMTSSRVIVIRLAHHATPSMTMPSDAPVRTMRRTDIVKPNPSGSGGIRRPVARIAAGRSASLHTFAAPAPVAVPRLTTGPMAWSTPQ